MQVGEELAVPPSLRARRRRLTPGVAQCGHGSLCVPGAAEGLVRLGNDVFVSLWYIGHRAGPPPLESSARHDQIVGRVRVCEHGMMIHDIRSRFHAAGKRPSRAAGRPRAGEYAW
jgi:hypothetical protein